MSGFQDPVTCSEARPQRAFRVAFFSVHPYASKRKAGFHWLAQAYRRAGWEVLFVTVGFSWISYLKRVVKTDAYDGPFNSWLQTTDGVWTYVWRPFFHPVNLRNAIFNRLSAPIFRTYGRQTPKEIEERVITADQIILESSAAILLFDQLRKANPHAHYVYRVSDDVNVIGNHPVLGTEEHRLAPLFDLISIPSALLTPKFAHCKNVQVLHHGIDPDIFAGIYQDPYPRDGRIRVLSVGATLFDYDAAITAATLFPEWGFYFFGDMGCFSNLANIHCRGEVKFDELKPYFVHADIGAAFYKLENGAEYLVDTSNKIAQYAAAHLPIVCPLASPSGRTDFFSYQMNNVASLKEAFLRASRVDRDSLKSFRPMSWDKVAQAIMSARARDHIQ